VIADYFGSIEKLLNNSALIVDKKLDFKEFSSEEGMVRGSLLFIGGYVLNFMEYIKIGKERPKYSFNFSPIFVRFKAKSLSANHYIIESLFLVPLPILILYMIDII